MTGPILLIDALSALHTAARTHPPTATAAGAPTGALAGVCALVAALDEAHRPSAWAFAFDLPGPSRRREAFPAYKAHRRRLSSAMLAQIEALRALPAALGVPAHAAPGWEADDVLASLAARLEATAPVVVVSADGDLLQLLRPGVTAAHLHARGRPPAHLDAAAFRARHGYPPSALPAFLAMVGDPTDGLPGIPGLGAPTAKSLCARHGDAAGILAALDAGRIGNRRLPPVLSAHREALLRWESLARARDDLALADPLAGPLDPGGLRSFAARWEIALPPGPRREG